MLRSPTISLLACASALLAGASPARSQTLSPELLEAVRAGPSEVRLDGDSASIPLHGPRNLPLIEARVNGTGPWRLLVDLGSNVVIFRRDVIDPAGAEVVVERSGTDIVRLDSLRIGDVLYTDVYGGSYDELDVDGVIGYNALGSLPFTLDFPGRRLVVHRDSLPSADGRAILDYVVVDRLPYILARLGADTLRLNFDTGATNRIVFPAVWKDRLPLAGPVRGGPVLSNNQTGTTTTELAPLSESITFGGFTIDAPTVILDPDVSDAWLGAGLLVDYVLDFDPDRLRVRIRGPAVAGPSADP
ncbi:MAG TPA: hypothetical protein VJ982_02765 [Gemmatimonadota bacterium]|nr:hypothetical protein [Gemmatimonadota bacterium]